MKTLEVTPRHLAARLPLWQYAYALHTGHLELPDAACCAAGKPIGERRHPDDCACIRYVILKTHRAQKPPPPPSHTPAEETEESDPERLTMGRLFRTMEELLRKFDGIYIADIRERLKITAPRRDDTSEAADEARTRLNWLRGRMQSLVKRKVLRRHKNGAYVTEHASAEALAGAYEAAEGQSRQNKIAYNKARRRKGK